MSTSTPTIRPLLGISTIFPDEVLEPGVYRGVHVAFDASEDELLRDFEATIEYHKSRGFGFYAPPTEGKIVAGISTVIQAKNQGFALDAVQEPVTFVSEVLSATQAGWLKTDVWVLRTV